jgi:hypothetical protein
VGAGSLPAGAATLAACVGARGATAEGAFVATPPFAAVRLPRLFAPHAPTPIRTIAARTTRTTRPPVRAREGGDAPTWVGPTLLGTRMTADETLDTFSGGDEARSPPAPVF